MVENLAHKSKLIHDNDIFILRSNRRREIIAQCTINRIKIFREHEKVCLDKIDHHKRRHDKYQDLAVINQTEHNKFILYNEQNMRRVFPISMTPFNFPKDTWRYKWLSTNLTMEKQGLLAWTNSCCDNNNQTLFYKVPHGCVVRCQSPRCHKPGGLVWVIRPEQGYKYNTYINKKKNNIGIGYPKFPTRCDECKISGFTKQSDQIYLSRLLIGLSRLRENNLFYKLPREVYQIIDYELYLSQKTQ